MALCGCRSGVEEKDCCARWHAGALAPTALALMRARYMAYVTQNLDYIEHTCTPALREEFNRLDAERYAEEATFLALHIIRTSGGGDGDDVGEVDFSFTYRLQGHELQQHETAQFVRVNGAWLYSGGEARSKQVPVTKAKQANRNDPCPCGSMKKYKKCCGQ